MKVHPFSQEELNIRYRYPAGNPSGLGKPEFSTPVGVKENMRRFASGEAPVWMPYGQYQVFGPEILPDNVARGRVFEENATSHKGGADLFGVNWVYDYSARGSMVRPGNPMLTDVNDWKAVIPFPDVDAWDWEGSAKRNARFLQTDLPIQMTQFSGLFERLISFMDFENAALALIDEEQEAAMDDLFSALTDVYIQIVDKCVEHFGLDWYLFHDDWGSQRQPFFSKATWERRIAPHVKRLVDHCHKRGVIFELHSCGHTESMLDVISTLGIDMWRPQTMNDLKGMYDAFGDRIHLGLSVTLPDHATQQEQIDAAREILERYTSPGKYVYLEAMPLPDDGGEAFFRTLYQGSRQAYLEQN